MVRKKYSGFNSQTAQNLLTGAGAFFVNYDMAADTFDTAVEANKLLGATRGGGQFTAVPTIRPIEVDGVDGLAKGLQVIDAWEVKMTASVIEVTTKTIKTALAASKVDTTGPDYDKITGKATIELADYVDNITWVGKLSGKDKPAIIQIYNVLNKNGLIVKTEKNGEVVVAFEFDAHYDAAELDEPPFAVFYPKAVV